MANASTEQRPRIVKAKHLGSDLGVNVHQSALRGRGLVSRTRDPVTTEKSTATTFGGANVREMTPHRPAPYADFHVQLLQ